MSAFNAWFFSKGLETLDIRTKAHSEKVSFACQVV